MSDAAAASTAPRISFRLLSLQRPPWARLPVRAPWPRSTAATALRATTPSSPIRSARRCARGSLSCRMGSVSDRIYAGRQVLAGLRALRRHCVPARGWVRGTAGTLRSRHPHTFPRRRCRSTRYYTCDANGVASAVQTVPKGMLCASGGLSPAALSPCPNNNCYATTSSRYLTGQVRSSPITLALQPAV